MIGKDVIFIIKSGQSIHFFNLNNFLPIKTKVDDLNISVEFEYSFVNDDNFPHTDIDIE